MFYKSYCNPRQGVFVKVDFEYISMKLKTYTLKDSIIKTVAPINRKYISISVRGIGRVNIMQHWIRTFSTAWSVSCWLPSEK